MQRFTGPFLRKEASLQQTHAQTAGSTGNCGRGACRATSCDDYFGIDLSIIQGWPSHFSRTSVPPT